LLKLQAWRWFWWNGCDVVDSRTNTVLATLRRTGGIEGPDRRPVGRVCNSTPAKIPRSTVSHRILGVSFPRKRFATAGGRVPHGSRWSQDWNIAPGAPAFSPKTETIESTAGPPLNQWFRRFRSALRNRSDSGGWLLDFSPEGTGIIDPRVRLAAALLRIQIEERYN
jgi:hypothetical protein